MKKSIKIFLIAFIAINIAVKAFAFSADVQDISGPKYFLAVKQAISQAKESINAAMFLMEIPERKGPSKVQSLVDELINAQKRGVKVEVILDQNVDFVNQRHESDWLGKVRSFRAYKQLKEAGVAVYYDEISTYTHAKAIVIDEKIVILGSTNWTQPSLARSIETDALIDSEEAAKSYLEYFKTIKIDDSIEKHIEFLKEGITISNNFMQSSKLAPQIMKQHDERSFDIYLFLLKEAKDPSTSLRTIHSGELELTLDYDVIAKYLGIDKKMDEIAYRRQITKVLRKLEEKYKLIKADLQYAKDAKVKLLNSEAFEGKAFHLPKDYFTFGWNRELSMRAKFCYLINFDEANISDTQPYWTKSVEDITQKYNISRDVIAKGMGELRRRKLIEVMYDDLTDKEYRKRKPKMYKIIRLYDPKKLDLKLARVAEQYGEAEYKTARKYAEIVFEEYSPQVIEDIILKTKQYGPKKIKDAFAIVAKKNIDNPKRKYSYVVGILENWGKR
ncbi:MAG: phospholipase D-like domain-containing protein [Candidatus Omnitrophica bacterium]|nr:phospholipase D-like domain-containing protein [Candidatus Omnitrophota bacterium]